MDVVDKIEMGQTHVASVLSFKTALSPHVDPTGEDAGAKGHQDLQDPPATLFPHEPNLFSFRKNGGCI